MENIPGQIITSLIIMAGLIIIAILAFIGFNQQAKNVAVDKCMEISIVDWEQKDGARGYNLVPEWLKTCMQKKGYE